MWRATRDPQRDFTPVHSGPFVDRSALDETDLTDMGEVEVGIERCTTPNAPRLNATLLERHDLDQIRDAAGLEQQSDIAFQRGLVAFDREMIVRVALDDKACQRALAQQRIARDVLAGDVAPLKHGDRHADFVAALLLITACDGQGADFFWA